MKIMVISVRVNPQLVRGHRGNLPHDSAQLDRSMKISGIVDEVFSFENSKGPKKSYSYED